MRKVLPVVTAALLAVTLIVAGCGKTAPQTTDAEKLIEESLKVMQSVTSYKAKGKINLSSSAAGAEEMDITFDMQIQQKGKEDFEGHAKMQSMGQDIELYILDGYVYSNSAGEGWVKQPIGEYSDFSKLASPEDIAKLGDAAQNAKIISQDSKYYKIAFDIDTAYLKELLGTQETTQNLSAEAKKIADEMLKGANVSAIFQLAKPDMYLVGMVMELGIPNMPSAGTVKMQEVIQLSDFNKPVDVSLPEEAKNAPEVTGSEDLFPTQ